MRLGSFVARPTAHQFQLHSCRRGLWRRPRRPVSDSTCRAAAVVGEAAQVVDHAIHAAPQALMRLLPADQLPLLASLRGICFDPACQGEQDRAFLTAITIPLVVLAAAVAFLLRPLPKERVEAGELFEDESTGTIFEAPEGAQPERDRLGELAFRAIGYTPWPLEAGGEGERIRIDVGPPGKKQPRTYVFNKILPQPSQLVTVTLPRPLGLVFEEDARNKRAVVVGFVPGGWQLASGNTRAVVAGFVPGGNAEQQMRRTRLDPGLATRAAAEGDVLRAATCTNIVYKTGALLFGAQRPERSIVVYGADGQRWKAVMEALQKGLVADGEVTLVLERPLAQRAQQAQQGQQAQQQQAQQQQQQGGAE